ncbi:hypothetical protein SteCoe_10783 [Stentor coeruleus]|uniref:Uncharacterized protein n=1 Tax=Stentor coeruleus TaxID=5963 RepID=A0A1R2CF05_9CILI|nr:hypothetical protein SteCoe_10783 [Stentor coeruleus]
MYQDLIIPTIYTPDKSEDISISSTRFETEQNKKKISKQLKLLEDLIEEKSLLVNSTGYNAKAHLVKEHSILSQKLENISSISSSQFKHRVEVHKIPVSIKHRKKQELDKELGLGPSKIPNPPPCIHYDTPKIGKINTTTWRGCPKPSWKSHNQIASSLNTTSLEYLVYEEGHRFPAMTRSSSIAKLHKPETEKSSIKTSRSAYSSPRPSGQLSKAISTQTPFGQKSQSVQSEVVPTVKKPRRASSKKQNSTPSPQGQSVFSPFIYPPAPPIYIQMPTFNSVPGGFQYPTYNTYQYPNYSAYSPENLGLSPKQATTNSNSHKTRQAKEVPIQAKIYRNSGLQTLLFEDSSSASLATTDKENSSLKAWYRNFGPGMTPADFLKRNKALYLKLIQNQYPRHLFPHVSRNRKSLINIKSELISRNRKSLINIKSELRKHKKKGKNKRVRILSPRLEKLSTPKRS